MLPTQRVNGESVRSSIMRIDLSRLVCNPHGKSNQRQNPSLQQHNSAEPKPPNQQAVINQ